MPNVLSQPCSSRANRLSFSNRLIPTIFTPALTNLRQIGQYYAMYASQFKGYAPLTDSGGSGFLGAQMYLAEGSPSDPLWAEAGWVNSGYFVRAGILGRSVTSGSGPTGLTTRIPASGAGGRVFYCPAVGVDDGGLDQFTYDRVPTYSGDTFNPWPPGVKNYDTRAGYSHRLGPDMMDGSNKSLPNNGRVWQWSFASVAYPDGTTRRCLRLNTNCYMPRMQQLNNKAIMADLLGTVREHMAHHRTGCNVLYGNGAVKWVPNSALCDSTGASLIQPYPAIGASNLGIWNPRKFLVFDKY